MSTKSRNSSTSKNTTHHKYYNLKKEAGKVATKACSAFSGFTAVMTKFFRGYVSSLSDGIDYVMSDGFSNDVYSKSKGRKKTAPKEIKTVTRNRRAKGINSKVVKTKTQDIVKQ